MKKNESNYERLRPMDFITPYIKLARAERPIGSWLLYLPCLWALVLTQADPSLYILFFFGAILMRGAGCVYNDLIDSPFDAKVARTKSRPLPKGDITPLNAILFLALLLACAFIILLMMNPLTIALGGLSLVLVAVYPFMKRITYWPQVMLGLTFSFGVPMAFCAQSQSFPLPAMILYIASVFWVIGYDTIYALQDKQDDMLLGLKSSALALGDWVKPALALFYSAFWLGVVITGFLYHASYAVLSDHACHCEPFALANHHS